MNNSAFKKFLIGTNIIPSNVSTLTASATLGTFGACTIHYQKIGNLYFNIWVSNGGGINFLIGSNSGASDAHVSMDQIASILGVTVNTYYDSVVEGPYMGAYIASVWTTIVPANNDRNVVSAFMSN